LYDEKDEAQKMANQETSQEDRTPAVRKQPKPEQVWIALAHCYRTMSSVIERSFEKTGLSLTDFMLLEALMHKGPMTITEIQSSALLATGSMTAAVDRVESKGLIARTLSKSDRRVRVLELTAEGKALISSVFEGHSANLKEWMSVLSAEECGATFSSLRKLEKHLKTIDNTAPQ
jgi:MarR family transcriptional regulator, 2-MHQ and catechol-resistance regulon repressor